MRRIAIGDVHGGLKGLKQLLSRMKISSEDQLIFLGDYVDGWSESAQVIRFLMEFSKVQTCIFIKGNHDVWCEDWLRTRNAASVWLEHGGTVTVESYSQFSEDEKQIHLQFFQQMKLYHLDEQNRLFLHAGFTSNNGVEAETSESNFYFDRTLWENAFKLSKRTDQTLIDSDNRLKMYKEIYIGHTPTLNFNSYEPMNVLNIWNVDTGAAFYGNLSAIDIDSKQHFQSDKLMQLYPYEKGRNERSLNEILGRK